MSSSWIFEPDANGKIAIDREVEAMNYVLPFGKHRGKTFAELMQTENGRSYMKWLSLQRCADPGFQEAHDRRLDKIAICFVIYDRFLQQSQNNSLSE